MTDLNNAEFNPRALNDEFLAKFKTGIHKAVLDEVKKDNELIMCLRGTYITIYYKSLQILKLHHTGRPEINSKYGINPKGKEYGYPNDFKAHKYFAEAKEKLSKYQPKSGCKQNKKEKEVQQAIVNKYNSEQNDPDLFILDIEYRQKAPCGERFDAIATFKDENNKSRLAFVEIKCGSGAISGTSGVKGHFKSARKFVNHLKDNKKYGESFYQDMKSIINQLNELGLYKNKFDDKTDFIKKPGLIYMFEKFTKNGKREIPIASVSVLGRLALNQTSIVNFGIEEAKYATMFFDKEKNLIGIRFSNQKEKSSFKIQWRENSGLFLTVKNFFEAYSIDFSQTYFCDVTQDEKDKSFIIVDLKTRRERR